MEIIQNNKIVRPAILVLFLLSAFLAAKTINELKSYSFIGGGVPVSNTVTVSGEGEAFAVADIASFSFSVIEEAKTVDVAQKAATEKMNRALAFLKENVEDKDIKTTSYNIYPKYEYTRQICNQFSCPPSNSVLVGYEVSQTISVKVRDTEKAGEILSAIGALGVSNVSGLSFTIDDEEKVAREARKEAIDDAKQKAKELSKDLGVRLVRVVNFNESNGGFPYPSYMKMESAMDAGGFGGGGPIPEIPMGENKVTSNVSITYEIR